MSAKDLIVKPITSKDARRFIKATHYSGKVVANSSLHFGVFMGEKLEGVMSYGPSINKRGTMGLVAGAKWNDFIELNRMAFSESLPRNSESRGISVSLKIIKARYPHIKWIVSFADGCQCGDGTIYRASGFILSGIKRNTTMLRLPTGEVTADKTFNNNVMKKYKGFTKQDCEKLKGFQLRYIYFIDKEARKRLTVPEIPFSKIQEMGAGMYKGEKITRGLIEEQQIPSTEGGASPTSTLQTKKAIHNG